MVHNHTLANSAFHNSGRRNIKLVIAYDGTAYHGFQRQQNALTIQEILEDKLVVLFGGPIKITGAGRTDAGVHAWGQVVNFFTGGVIPVSRIPRAAQSVLPGDVVVRQAEEVPAAFHARHSAQSKIYVYRIYQGVVPDPFRRNYAWHIVNSLDAALMHEAAQHIVGTHDFSAFRAAGGAPIDPVRTILEAGCAVSGSMIELRFWGTGFLYHMVRNLVGTLVDVGMGRLTLQNFKLILASRDRKQAGITAPPQGLYLHTVNYNSTY